MAINKFNIAGIVDITAAILLAFSDVPLISHFKWIVVIALAIKGVRNLLVQ